VTDAKKIISDRIPVRGNRAEADQIADAVIHALTASGYVIEKGWMPIETAPKDETPTLLLVGFPPPDHQIPDLRRVVIGTHCTSSDGREFGEGYWWIYGAHGGARATSKYIGLPTHWRPLPPAPSPGV
jgi:hypothetical protein